MYIYICGISIVCLHLFDFPWICAALPLPGFLHRSAWSWEESIHLCVWVSGICPMTWYSSWEVVKHRHGIRYVTSAWMTIDSQNIFIFKWVIDGFYVGCFVLKTQLVQVSSNIFSEFQNNRANPWDALAKKTTTLGRLQNWWRRICCHMLSFCWA